MRKGPEAIGYFAPRRTGLHPISVLAVLAYIAKFKRNAALAAVFREEIFLIILTLKIFIMIIASIALTPMIAAAGWAFLVWAGGGGFGLALCVFVVLKLLGK
jgi:hypothetical protein